jgi:hypothetical protein
MNQYNYKAIDLAYDDYAEATPQNIGVYGDLFGDKTTPQRQYFEKCAGSNPSAKMLPTEAYKCCISSCEVVEDKENCFQGCNDLIRIWSRQDPYNKCVNRSVCNGKQFIRFHAPTRGYSTHQECLHGEKSKILNCCLKNCEHQYLYPNCREHCESAYDFDIQEGYEEKFNLDIKKFPVYLDVILIISIIIILCGIIALIYTIRRK